tara:strand:- start:40 stop:315 length:276 start_codon:yes stop_codon:yes gene_type:complete
MNVPHYDILDLDNNKPKRGETRVTISIPDVSVFMMNVPNKYMAIIGSIARGAMYSAGYSNGDYWTAAVFHVEKTVNGPVFSRKIVAGSDEY